MCTMKASKSKEAKHRKHNLLIVQEKKLIFKEHARAVKSKAIAHTVDCPLITIYTVLNRREKIKGALHVADGEIPWGCQKLCKAKFPEVHVEAALQ